MNFSAAPSRSASARSTHRVCTRLLVSVRSASEALAAAKGGAHLIDLKEPLAGSLGPVPVADWPSIRAVIPAGIPVSLALGELLDPRIAERASEAVGFQFAKIGLAGCRDRADWPDLWQAVWRRLPAQATRVAVAYADAETAVSPQPEQVVEAAGKAGCKALLIDTFGKSAGGLLDHLPGSRLGAIVERARERGLAIVLAGSLKLDWLNDLLRINVDYIAVRGAVCRGNRSSQLDPELVALWSGRLRDLQAETGE